MLVNEVKALRSWGLHFCTGVRYTQVINGCVIDTEGTRVVRPGRSWSVESWISCFNLVV